MNRSWIVLVAATLFLQTVNAQSVTIQVSATEGRIKVSPYIYGRNNNFSDNSGSPTTASTIIYYKEAGLRFARENGGNNATKYNWRRKLSSHPDWYNNVYYHDWDYASKTIEASMPDMQTMWAFQLIGKTASNKNNNFNDWVYNGSAWWSGVNQNLAGGGTVNPAGGSTALVDGNPALYLMDWPADSTTEILNHWFGTGGVGLNQNNLLYWSMDNEPEIWHGTHDDIMKTQITASEFIDRYIEVAKKARAKFQNIKLCGPVPANEWQWFKYADESLSIDGKYYCWLEYFIKRVADEQKASGIRLLDVLDVHWYPGESSNSDLVQLYRVFYDKTYSYPGANGLRTINGGWDTSLTSEYIFQRINDWLIKYFGENNGITIGLTETAINSSDPNIISVTYASILGTFADNGVEIFTPWTWKTGMWETLHLFSRYAKSIRVKTISSLDATVSGYTTINNNSDSITVILVNRDLGSSRTTTVNLTGFNVPDGGYTTKQLSSLPSSETFNSHSSNALKNSTVNVTANSFTISLPALSTTAIILKGTGTSVEETSAGDSDINPLRLYPNPACDRVSIDLGPEAQSICKVVIYDISGRVVDSYLMESQGNGILNINTEKYGKGIYVIEVANKSFDKTAKLMIMK
jgi:hypothetical protein